MEDLFPGFATKLITGEGAKIHARVGGSGPGLLLLHGYPQSHAAWHRVALRLAETHTVVAADLRGYGQSSCPPTDMEHRPYSKRAMAKEMVSIMRALGFDRFRVMGHDRGGRVAYRIALDAPEVAEKLVVLDIISTRDQWTAENQKVRLKMFHWAFLAQPAPMPESLIGRDPVDWLEGRFKRGTQERSLEAIDPRAFAEYKRYFQDPDHIHATCEDYRAGARCDLDDDEQDWAVGRRIRCPMLTLWATEGPLIDIPDPLALWRAWCPNVQGHAIDSGHFIAEEQPERLLESVLPFLSENAQ